MSKPAFDPTKPFDPVDVPAAAKPPFDPSKPFDETRNPEDISYLESLGRGAKEMLPFGGYANNAYSAIKNRSISSPEYIKDRDLQNQKDEESFKANPKVYRVGEGLGLGAGLLAPGMILGKLGLLGEGADAAQALSRAQKIKTAAGAGAVAGLLNDPGDVKGEVNPIQPIQRGTNGLIGAVSGPLLMEGAEKAGQIVAPYIENLADSFAGRAAKNAFSSLRGYKKDIKNAVSRDQVDKIGKNLLDEGILDGMPKSIPSLVKATDEKASEYGQQYGNILKEINDTAKPVIDPKTITDRVRDRLKVEDETFPYQRDANNWLEEQLASYESAKGTGIDLQQAQKLKQDMNKDAKWNTFFQGEVPPKVQLAREMYHAANGAIDDAVDKFAPQSGISKEAVQDLRSKIHLLKTANTIVSGRELGEVSNRYLSPSDYMAGVAGFLAHSGGEDGVLESLAKRGITGAATAGINKFGREYGSQILSKGQNAASGLLGGAADRLNNLGGNTAGQIIGRGLLQGGRPSCQKEQRCAGTRDKTVETLWKSIQTIQFRHRSSCMWQRRLSCLALIRLLLVKFSYHHYGAPCHLCQRN